MFSVQYSNSNKGVSFFSWLQHTGSRNPVSRRTGETITLSPEDAMAELQKYEDLIKREGVHEAFPKYAEQRSDCSSFKHQGDLGDFGRGRWKNIRHFV